MASSSAAKAGGIASRSWRNSSAKPGSPVSAKPRAALSAALTCTLSSANCLSTATVRSVANESRRDLVSSPIDMPPIISRIIRQIPRMNRCDRTVLFLLWLEMRHHLLLETVVDRDQQRLWREGLAQTAGRAEFKRHAQEIGRGRVRVGEGVAGHGDQRNLRRRFVEHANGLEASHMRHEDVDDHDVEFGKRQLAH